MPDRMLGSTVRVAGMWAVTIISDGAAGADACALGWSEVQDPAPEPDEVLISVAASAVNRADLSQVAGHYPPPPGASDILGMECSGTVTALGDGVTGWSVGDECCALLAGGGYAELVCCPVEQLLPIPTGVDLVSAAALPEAACTVWSNLVMTAGLQRGELLLVHGGGSGIGTMAIQVAVALGAAVAVTASRDAILARCAALGAEHTINYTVDDFDTVIRAATGGADVILDMVGAKYLQRNVSALKDGGRLVIIGRQGGSRAELDISALMSKRASVIGTTLRSRPVNGKGSKAAVVQQVSEHLWPLIAAGTVRPMIEVVLPMTQAADAHRRLLEGGHFGKIVLRVPGS